MNNQKNFTKRIDHVPTIQIQNCEIKFVHNRRWKIKKKKKQRNTAIPPIPFLLFLHVFRIIKDAKSLAPHRQFVIPHSQFVIEKNPASKHRDGIGK